jgi:sortase A
LLAAGLAMLGYVGFTLVHAYAYQFYEGRAFDRRVREHQAGHVQTRSAIVRAAQRPHSSEAAAPRPVRHGPIARLEIPGVGLNTLVLEGDDARTLKLGIGHIPGTAFPGEAGNIGIAGHRDTFFRCLRNIKTGDTITVRTTEETYNYRVETINVIDPSQIAVLGPTADNRLTLVTCYPFNFVGAAPKRFIVSARQIMALQRFPVRNAKGPKTG